MQDQAANLRKIMGQKPAEPKPSKLIAVAGGRKASGKDAFAVNFALALSAAGNSVLLVDMDHNSEIAAKLLGIEHYEALDAMLGGQKRIEEIARKGKNGIRLVSGGEALLDMAGVRRELVKKKEDKLAAYCSDFNYVLMVCKDGLDEGVKRFLRAAGPCLVITGLSPEAIVDTFKLIRTSGIAPRARIVVDSEALSQEARATAENFLQIVKKTEGIAPGILGWIGGKELAEKAAEGGEAVFTEYPESGASAAIKDMAESFINGDSERSFGMADFLERVRG